MKYFVIVLLMASYAFAINPIARWPLDDQAGTTVIRDVIGTTNGTWVGTELVTDGIFAAWSGFADPGNEPSNWDVLIDGGAVEPTRKFVDATNKCQYITEGNNIQLSQDILTVGKAYTLTFEVTARSAGSIQVLLGSGTISGLFSSVTSHTFTGVASGDGLLRLRRGANEATNITLTGVSVREIPFSNGTGIVFDGVGDYIDIGIASATKTISFWINQDDVAGNEYPIDLNGTDYLSVESGVVTVNGFSGHTLYVDGVVGTSGVTTIDATWHHIVITKSTNNSVLDFDIGRADIGPAVYFAGKISDVRLYPPELTANQVKGLFKGEGRKLRARYNNKEYEPSLRARYN